jgi:hypothetical protein
MPKVSYLEPKVLSVPRAGLGRALPVALDAENDRNRWRPCENRFVVNIGAIQEILFTRNKEFTETAASIILLRTN